MISLKLDDLLVRGQYKYTSKELETNIKAKKNKK